MDLIGKKDPLRREAFHEALNEWVSYSQAGDVVGDIERYGGKAWVWVKHLGNHYYRNADTTYNGVHEYLDLVRMHGESIRWSVIDNSRGVKNKAAFGPNQVTIDGFYLYRA